MEFACAPIVPLVKLLGGTLLLAPAALLPVVVVKAGVFAWREPTLGGVSAMGRMLWANIISSLIGLVMAFPYVVPSAALLWFFVAAAVLFSLALGPGRRIAGLPASARPSWMPSSGWAVAGLVAGLTVLTWVLFAASQYILEWSGAHPAVYWAVKFSFVLTGIAAAMLITTIWEENAIARWLPPSERGGRSYFPAVVEANLAAFFVAAAVGAALMVPERLGEPGFLALLWESALAG